MYDPRRAVSTRRSMSHVSFPTRLIRSALVPFFFMRAGHVKCMRVPLRTTPEHGITLYSTRDSREHLLQMDAFEL